MKALLTLCLLFLTLGNDSAQALSSDFKTIPVNKKIGEFPDAFDLSSPLTACISFNYLLLNGRESQMGAASSQRIRAYFSDSDKPDAEVNEKNRAAILNAFVNEVIVYKDAVAGVISRPSESYFSIRFMSHENNQWLNAGEDMAQSLPDSRMLFARKAERFYDFTKRIPILAQIPTDAAPFAGYLKEKGQDPKAFVLKAVAKHRLVIYGEIHRRQWSWELCRRVLNDKRFPESTGTIFMEISAHKQNDLDAFLAKETLDPELVLGVFREMQTEGWTDKGMYEFLLDVWRLNRTLPAEKRVKVVAVDIPRPFSTFRTSEEQKKFFDTVMNRNAFMAETIEKGLRSNRDPRHGLFIVGTLHVCKSPAPGYASSTSAAEIPSAGALLAAALPRGDVYAIFTHQAIMDNRGRIPGRIRYGIFDEAFSLNGDAPAAFEISGSPFGKEPFDALPEISYLTSTGTFADNYDGYIYLGPLDDEPSDYILPELYSDDFVLELSRRAALDNTTLPRWFGIEEAGRKAILDRQKRYGEGAKRWGRLPPLKAARPGR
jgi:hypothetical protein